MKECYDAMGGGYEDTIGRIRREASLERFVLKFLDDGSFDDLVDGLNKHDYDKAFRGAHTLKGLAGNLGFDRLAASSSRLCERLRAGYDDTVPGLMAETSGDYKLTMDAIRSYRDDMEGE